MEGQTSDNSSPASPGGFVVAGFRYDPDRPFTPEEIAALEADPDGQVEVNYADFTADGDGSYPLEIVGESFYDAPIARALGLKLEANRDAVHERRIAVLAFDDENAADPNAVALTFGTEVCGYLPRELAPRFRRLVEAKKPGATMAGVWVLVTGGWNRGRGDRGFFGIRVDLHI